MKTKLLLNLVIQGAGAVLALTALTAVCLFLHFPREIVICLFAGLLVGLSYSGNVRFRSSWRSSPHFRSTFLARVHPNSTESAQLGDGGLFSIIAWTMTTMVATLRRRGRELEDANEKMREQQARELERANRLMLVGEMTTSIVTKSISR